MAIASGIWYGVIAYLAYRAGSDWTALTHMISRSGRLAALVAAVLVLAGVLAWLVHRRRARVIE
jgi:membrane protein DedA with SNARE-associated domain